MNEFKSYPDGYNKLMKKLIPFYYFSFRKTMMKLLIRIIAEG